MKINLRKLGKSMVPSVLAVIRDGNRIDRYLNLVRVPGCAPSLYLSDSNGAADRSARIPVGLDTTEEEEAVVAKRLIEDVLRVSL